MAPPASAAPEIASHRRWTVPRLAVAGLGLASGLLLEFGMERALAADITYAAAAVLAGPDTFRNAWRAMRRRRLGMSFLMTIAAIGAFATGHGEEGAAVLLLFAVAERQSVVSLPRRRSIPAATCSRQA